MNKINLKTSLLLISLVVMFTITAVNAVDIDDTDDVAIITQDEAIEPVVTEKINNEKLIEEVDENVQTTEKSIEKNQQTLQKKASKQTSTITVGSTKNTIVGNQLSIYGKLSSNGLDIPYQQVSINVEGKKYSIKTTKYGNYNLKIDTTQVGNKTITASYGGNVNYTGSTATTTYVARKATEITLGSTSWVYVGDKVCIYGKLTSSGDDVPYGVVKVTVNGKINVVNTTKYGNYKLYVTALKEGNNNITAAHPVTNTYAASSATTTFFADKKISTISVGSTSEVSVGGKVCIYGKLTANSNDLPYEKIIVNVAGKDYLTNTTKYGNYKLYVIATNGGYNTITANYAGSSIYTEAIDTTYFYAEPLDTVLTVGCTKKVFVGSNLCIYGKLTANGKDLANQEIRICLPDEDYTVTTTKYGNYKLNVIVSSYEGDYVDVYYDGNDEYYSSENYTYFEVEFKSSSLTVGTTKNVIKGENVCIYGKLTGEGKDLPYKNVTIYVEDKEYTATTTKYGNYKIYVKPSTIGINYVYVCFDEDGAYEYSSADTTFTLFKDRHALEVLQSIEGIYSIAATFTYGGAGTGLSPEKAWEYYQSGGRNFDCYDCSNWLFYCLREKGIACRIVQGSSPSSGSGTHRVVQIYEEGTWRCPKQAWSLDMNLRPFTPEDKYPLTPKLTFDGTKTIYG